MFDAYGNEESGGRGVAGGKLYGDDDGVDFMWKCNKKSMIKLHHVASKAAASRRYSVLNWCNTTSTLLYCNRQIRLGGYNMTM